MFERMEGLFTKKEMKKIEQAKVLLVGVGGVGSYALEALFRSGFQNITVVDKDIFLMNNMNRQLYATQDTLGRPKVDIAEERAKQISSKICLKKHFCFLGKDTYSVIQEKYDYIIDACDSVDAKVLLAHLAQETHASLFISLGMANRIDARKIKLTTLAKTHDDGLAKILRQRFRKEGLSLDIPVVFSEEAPLKCGTKLYSYVTVPAIAGLYLVNAIILDIKNKQLS